MLKLRDILKPESILGTLSSHDKRGVLREFAERASQIVDISAETILETLENREKLGSTAVGHGVAIPHGKVAGIQNLAALFGRSESGIDFQSHDQQPAHLFFVILAPEAAVGNYLHALARLSRLVRDEHVRTQLMTCDLKELYKTLIAEDDKL